MLVELDCVEPIAGDEPLQDLFGNGASPWADLQDISRFAGPAQWRGQGAGKESAARKNGAGGTEVPARFAQEGAAFAKEIHRHMRSIGEFAALQVAYRSIADF
jgi:hypothetical protein